MTPAVATCENHAQREAIGVCVKCRTRVCSECSTKVEGINYCVSCLAGLAVKGNRKGGAGKAARGKGYLAASFYAVLLVLGTWVMLEALLPGGA